MSAREKPHHCTTSCCNPSPEGGKMILRGYREGARSRTQYPRSTEFRFRAKISNGKFDADVL